MSASGEVTRPWSKGCVDEASRMYLSERAPNPRRPRRPRGRYATVRIGQVRLPIGLECDTLQSCIRMTSTSSRMHHKYQSVCKPSIALSHSTIKPREKLAEIDDFRQAWVSCGPARSRPTNLDLLGAGWASMIVTGLDLPDLVNDAPSLPVRFRQVLLILYSSHWLSTYCPTTKTSALLLPISAPDSKAIDSHGCSLGPPRRQLTAPTPPPSLNE